MEGCVRVSVGLIRVEPLGEVLQATLNNTSQIQTFPRLQRVQYFPLFTARKILVMTVLEPAKRSPQSRPNAVDPRPRKVTTTDITPHAAGALPSDLGPIHDRLHNLRRRGARNQAEVSRKVRWDNPNNYSAPECLGCFNPH